MGILFTLRHSIKYTIPGTYSMAYYNNRLLSQMYVYFYITSSPLAKQQNKSYVIPYYIYAVFRIRKIFALIGIGGPGSSPSPSDCTRTIETPHYY